MKKQKNCNWTNLNSQYKLLFFKFPQMFKNQTLLILLIGLISVRNTVQACQAQTSLDTIMQDSITLHFDKTRQKNLYQYPEIFHSAPRLALSISKFQIKNLTNIQYHIATIFNSNNHTIAFHVVFPFMAGIWKLIRVDFWIIDQEMHDIAINFIVFENVQSGTVSTFNYTQKQEDMINKLNQHNGYEPAIFTTSILGISANFTAVFQVKIDAKIVKQNLLQENSKNIIVLTAESGKSTFIKLIRFGYILFAPSRLSNIRHHYFGFNMNLSPIYPSSLHSHHVLQHNLTIFPASYSLLGMKSLSMPISTTFSLQFRPQIGHIELIQAISLHKVDISLNFLVIGMDMMLACINCPQSYVKQTKEEIMCVGAKQCGDQIPNIDQEGIYYSCRPCVGNMEKNGGKCQCLKGYEPKGDGTCKKIQIFKSLAQCSDPNSVKDKATGKCVCKQGYFADQFGVCGCNPNNSYWDLNTQSCMCLPGFQKSSTENKCISIGTECGPNQLYTQNGCQCDDFTVKKQKDQGFDCVQCSSGTYKPEGKNQCVRCSQACKQCISEIFCLTCNRGFYFRDFQCDSRCGDGNRVVGQGCDDGNSNDGDGCSSHCIVQYGYQCNQDFNKRSRCFPKSSLIQIPPIKSQPVINTTLNLSQTHTVPAPTSVPSAASNPVPVNPPVLNSSDYKLSISKNSPIYLSSGIVVQLLVKPQKKRTQSELKSMIKIQIGDKKAQPPSVYISQDRSKLSHIRCYMHYNNQLPVVNFSFKIWAKLDENVWKSVTLYSQISNTLSKSLQALDQDSYLL